MTANTYMQGLDAEMRMASIELAKAISTVTKESCSLETMRFTEVVSLGEQSSYVRKKVVHLIGLSEVRAQTRGLVKSLGGVR